MVFIIHASERILIFRILFFNSFMRVFMAEKESRTERKKRETRERILAAAEKFFVLENSYKKVTVRKIAEEADVSVGALYLHFRTKEDILATLFCRYINELLEEARANLSGNEKGAEKLNILFNYLDTISRTSRFNLYIQISFLDSSESEVIEEKIITEIEKGMKKITILITEIVRQGKKDGSIISSIDSETLAVSIYNIITPLLLSLSYKNSILHSTMYFQDKVYTDSVFSVLKTIISKGITISA